MYTIIDIETTGNGLKGNKITEISIFKFDGEKVVDEFTSLVNPECPIPHFITGLTGIDNETVRNAPTFGQIADQVLEITKDCIFVAHAVNFDYGVIKEEFRRLNIDFVRKKLCTVRLSRRLVPGLHSYSLGKLCAAMGISITDRHRARGDAEATVILFEKLLALPDTEKLIKAHLNSKSQEATLPPNLNKKTVEELPQKPGIYYFLDTQHTIIYVGKAKNLKKRVLGHFYDKSEHEIKLCREIAHIDYELSGSELVALLMESAAIKKHYPKYNRAQKKTPKQYAVFSYEDRMGILHLGYAPMAKHYNTLVTINSPTACRDFLNDLVKEFQLCPKYCQLSRSNNCSEQGVFTSCKGICEGKESVENYNERVQLALKTISEQRKNLFIEEKGRSEDEKAVIVIKDGRYEGYGFIPNTLEINSKEDIEAAITQQQHTLDTERILSSHLRKTMGIIL